MPKTDWNYDTIGAESSAPVTFLKERDTVMRKFIETAAGIIAGGLITYAFLKTKEKPETVPAPEPDAEPAQPDVTDMQPVTSPNPLDKAEHADIDIHICETGADAKHYTLRTYDRAQTNAVYDALVKHNQDIIHDYSLVLSPEESIPPLIVSFTAKVHGVSTPVAWEKKIRRTNCRGEDVADRIMSCAGFLDYRKNSIWKLPDYLTNQEGLPWE